MQNGALAAEEASLRIDSTLMRALNRGEMHMQMPAVALTLCAAGAGDLPRAFREMQSPSDPV